MQTLNALSLALPSKPIQSQWTPFLYRKERVLTRQDNETKTTSFIPRTSCVVAAPPGMKPGARLQNALSLQQFQMKFTLVVALADASFHLVCSSLCVGNA